MCVCVVGIAVDKMLINVTLLLLSSHYSFSRLPSHVPLLPVSLLPVFSSPPHTPTQALRNKLVTMLKEDNADIFDKLPPRVCRNGFSVKHYAGPVGYDCDGFVDKNKDSLSPDLQQLLQASTDNFTKMMFEARLKESQKPKKPAAKGGRGGRRATSSSLTASSVATQFKSSLTLLMADINKTNVSYVRCIKPNPNKSPDEFQHAMVIDQLRCAGVIEAIRISRAAYPNRMPHPECVLRFGILPGGGSFRTDRDGCIGLLHALIGPPSKGKSVHYEVGKLPELPPGASLVVNPVAAGSESKEGKQEGGEEGGDGEVGYAVGNSKIYFNVGVLERLEKRRETRVQELVIRAQRILRGALGRWHFAMFKKALTCLQSVARSMIQRKRFLKGKTGAMSMQARWRGVRGRRVARRRLENVTATLLQSRFRMHVKQRQFHRQKNAALRVQTFTRGRLQKRRYAVQLGEAREQAKMENQLQALQDRLAEEQRKQAVAMAEQRVAMEAAIAQARAEGAASPGKPTGGPGGEMGGMGGMGGGKAEEGDSLTAATAHMLETMKGDNAKLRHDNERLTAENDDLKVRLENTAL